ncbi:MAG: hypothetical protein ACOYOK_11080 [Pseudobdellovibrionaceae bacterium]
MVNTGAFALLSGWLESQFAFYVVGQIFSATDYLYLFLIWCAGTLVGFVPAIKASRLALKDGLAVKT